MKCPECDAPENRVVDTRDSSGGRAVRRRRECGVCGHRFTSYERVEERPLQVVKSDGSAEPFDRSKLLRSLALACAKRPISASAIEGLADAIEGDLTGSARVEVPSSEIGERVMAHLEPLDRVAYIRFASVYRNFQDIGEFHDVVKDLEVREARGLRAKGQEELLF